MPTPASPSLTAEARKAMSFARQLCLSKKLRFTRIRHDILEALWRHDAPMKAYDLQDYMQRVYGQKINPPTIYRTLEFLHENGLIHRIESLNAFAACHDNLDYHEGQFVICTRCGHVEEIHEDDLMSQLGQRLEARGFTLREQMVELRVDCLRQLCPNQQAREQTLPEPPETAD